MAGCARATERWGGKLICGKHFPTEERLGFGYGSKSIHLGTAGLSPCFHLPGPGILGLPTIFDTHGHLSPFLVKGAPAHFPSHRLRLQTVLQELPVRFARRLKHIERVENWAHRQIWVELRGHDIIAELGYGSDFKPPGDRRF